MSKLPESVLKEIDIRTVNGTGMVYSTDMIFISLLSYQLGRKEGLEEAAKEPRLISCTDYLLNDDWDRGWDKAVEIIEQRIRSLIEGK